MSAVMADAIPRRHPERELPSRHLEIASTRVQRRSRPKSFYALVAVGCLFSIVIVQLLISIMVSNGAYQISALQFQLKELTRDQQSLTDQLRVLTSPQNLSDTAETLGMVPNSSTAYLRLSDGVVLGTPHAAAAGKTLLHAQDGGPLIPNQLLNGLNLTPVSVVSPSTATTGAPESGVSAISVTSDNSGLPTPISR